MNLVARSSPISAVDGNDPAVGDTSDPSFCAAGLLARCAPNGHHARVVSEWRLVDTNEAMSPSAAVALLRARLRSGQWETWFESDSGELLSIVTNGHRAMVMLLQEPGDAGEHAIDASAGESTSTGYVLANGQVDSYADVDTVTIADAMERVAQIG